MQHSKHHYQKGRNAKINGFLVVTQARTSNSKQIMQKEVVTMVVWEILITMIRAGEQGCSRLCLWETRAMLYGVASISSEVATK